MPALATRVTSRRYRHVRGKHVTQGAPELRFAAVGDAAGSRPRRLRPDRLALPERVSGCSSAATLQEFLGLCHVSAGRPRRCTCLPSRFPSGNRIGEPWLRCAVVVRRPWSDARSRAVGPRERKGLSSQLSTAGPCSAEISSNAQKLSIRRRQARTAPATPRRRACRACRRCAAVGRRALQNRPRPAAARPVPWSWPGCVPSC